MANLLRSAKSGSDWTGNELAAYNINIVQQTAIEFFGAHPSSSLSAIDPAFINNDTQAVGPEVSKDTYRVLRLLDLATKGNTGMESAIDDFARETLRIMDYEDREYDLVLRSRYEIPLAICGEANRSAQTDLCLIQGSSTILLVVQEDKTIYSKKDPEPQVIAEAIAAYQYNSRILQNHITEMTIPCITMTGTRPTFYLVPVTKELSDAVVSGQYPASVTTVFKCTVPIITRRLSEGMREPGYRKVALQYFEAFKTLAKQHWQRLVV